MLKVTTRYLASSFIIPFFLGTIFFVAFLITFYLFRIIELIVNKGLAPFTVLMMIINLAITFLPLAIPISIFFALIYVMGHFSEDSEVIALRSFGITNQQIYKPFFYLALLIAVTMQFLQSTIVPKANADFKNMIVKISSSGMLTNIKSGQFFGEIPNVTLFAEEVSKSGLEFKNIFLHLNKNNEKEKKIIFAKQGELVRLNRANGNENSFDLRMILLNGNIIDQDKNEKNLGKILFQKYDFPILNSDVGFKTLNKDSMKSNRELVEIIKTKKLIYFNSISNQSDSKLIKENKSTLYKTQNELYSRYVTFPQILCFSFLGFSLGIKRRRGSGGNHSKLAILFLLAYNIIYFGLLGISQKGLLSPEITHIIPCFFIFLSGLYFFKKLDWI